MRTNMPVTNVEYQVKPTDMIVSKTDTRGLITYINADFVRISGFTEKELIGQPHNIVRHPDMPEEAFADLWDTLKAGRPWTGLVKNRCKNGDYYWVVANATPIREGNQIVGYMSVRSAPTRAQIDAADRAYRLFKEGKQGNLKIRDGQAVKGGWHRWLDPIRKQSITARVNWLAGALAACVLGMVALSYGSDAEAAQRMQAWSRWVGGFGLAVLGLLAYTVSTRLRKPLAQAEQYLNQLSQGQYGIQIDVGTHDEVGRVLMAMKSMQIRMGFELAETKRLVEETTRIKIALDNVSTNVMIADNDRNIIYMNTSVDKLMRAAESDMRKALPNFNAATLLGSNIDQFHKNPAHQKNMLATFTATHRVEMDIGGRTFRLTANPVLSDKGDRLGSVMEWMDRTAEVKVEREVASIVAAAVKGDFTQRIEMQGKDGFFLQLGEGMNKLLDTTATGLNEVQRMLAALAQGDLNQRITAEFEGTFGQLKDDANSTAEKLKEIVLQIKGATDAINTASKEIAAGNADLSQRTEEQASSLEETASSMEELTSTVKQNAENAKQANQLAKGASEIAVKGGDVVGGVVGTMAAINDSSRKIVDIISVIDGIAFQTNILALNAAVEAARAGEQGRGFAVVAGEVRNLAQRSAAAAKEIKTLIGDSVEKVEGGTKLVEEAGKTMEEIVTAVKRVTDIMSEISAASLEQSSGIEQVNQAITQMDEVTQQNAALVEEAAAAAESMEEQAQSLATAVSVFRVNDAMAAAAPVRAHAPTVVAPVAAKSVAAPKRAPRTTPPAEDDWAEF